MKGFVYVLKSENDRFYVGSADNISRRILQHINGHTQTTRNMKNFQLVLVQEYNSLLDARNIERKIKSFKRKDYI